MMRNWLIVLLLVSVTTVRVQDEFVLGEPLLEEVEIPLHNLVWSANSSTLWIEGQLWFEGIATIQSYAYDVAAEKLTELDDSPFTDTLSAEEQAFFQTKDVIFTSPYHPDIIFPSTLYVPCGNECNGQLIMAGKDTRAIQDKVGTGWYRPLDFTNQSGFNVFWSRDGKAAVIVMYLNYAGQLIYYHVRLDGDYEDIIINFGEVVESQLFALSEGGTRILYRNYNAEDEKAELRLGEVQTIQFQHTEATAQNTEPLVLGENVIGANFIAGSPDIVYVNESGIQRRPSVPYGVLSSLNPDINSTWAQAVVFSPDNQYAAVLADGNLYVLPTEIDLSVPG
jgi:hypothetical protein